MSLFENIEAFYNRKHLHCKLENKVPEEYEYAS